MNGWLRKLAVLTAMVVFIGGCSGGKKSLTPVTADFSCEAAITYRELELEATLTRYVDGKLVLAFARPTSLEGITIGWDGKDMTMELGGMSLNIVADKIPESALIRCLLRVLAASHPEGTQTDEGYTVTGEVEDMAYVLVCHPETGLPLSLTVPEEELTATFTETKRLTVQTQ